MKQDRVRAGEALSELSVRLGVPGCMILRANRILSCAWLLPDREIDVPDALFCLYDRGECPVAALMRPVGGEDVDGTDGGGARGAAELV